MQSRSPVLVGLCVLCYFVEINGARVSEHKVAAEFEAEDGQSQARQEGDGDPQGTSGCPGCTKSVTLAGKKGCVPGFCPSLCGHTVWKKAAQYYVYNYLKKEVCTKRQAWVAFEDGASMTKQPGEQASSGVTSTLTDGSGQINVLWRFDKGKCDGRDTGSALVLCSELQAAEPRFPTTLFADTSIDWCNSVNGCL